MLSREEKSFVLKNAYAGEHLVDYFAAVSKMEPFLISNYLCYFKDDWLNFIGYPLGEEFEEGKFRKILDEAVERFHPEYLGVVAPLPLKPCQKRSSDEYYRIELASFKIKKDLRYRIRKAGEKLKVEESEGLTQQHLKLISEYCKKEVDEYVRNLFEKIPDYLSACKTAKIFSALQDDVLSAFLIFEDAAESYTFYQFGFYSKQNYVAGAADLLLHEMICRALREGKKYVNLGLGASEGIKKFKRKWSGKPFLKYEMCVGSRALKLAELWGI